MSATAVTNVATIHTRNASHFLCTAMQSDLLELNRASVVGWGSPHEAECLILDSGLSPIAMSDRDLCRNTVT